MWEDWDERDWATLGTGDWKSDRTCKLPWHWACVRFDRIELYRSAVHSLLQPDGSFFLYDMATVALASAIALYARLGKTPRMLVSDNKNLTVACGLTVLSICLNYGSQALGLEAVAPYAVAAIGRGPWHSASFRHVV